MAKKYIKNSEGIVRAVTSENLQLEKPLLNENYDIEVHNRNMDKIDSAIQEVKGKIDGLELVASNVKMADGTTVQTTVTTNKSNISTLQSEVSANKTSILSNKNEIESLKQSVSNGKTLVANAITDKGITTLVTDTFEVMANNIVNIATATKVVASDNYLFANKQKTNGWFTIEAQSTDYITCQEVVCTFEGSVRCSARVWTNDTAYILFELVRDGAVISSKEMTTYSTSFVELSGDLSEIEAGDIIRFKVKPSKSYYKVVSQILELRGDVV